ncbi:MAG: hypothetical protein JRF18_02700 [Deltaproteobacteria bacterium]|nr:hypothetical protein [Deltaproteobacteria bacterium]
MKILLAVVGLLLLIVTGGMADEPPAWSEFEVWSSNGVCFATVTVRGRNDKLSQCDWKYQLTVYKRGKRDTELWSCEYLYDGYAGGLLSDDGTTFVYVNFWYYEKHPVVTIYQNGMLKKQITGQEFKVKRSKLQRTVSHDVWWDPSRDHRFIRTEGIPLGLEINTIDSQKIVIDLLSFEMRGS